MARFTQLVRRRLSAVADRASGYAASSRPGRVVPGFEPLADALVHAGNPEACAGEVGRDLAGDGVALSQALDDLEATYAAVGAGRPRYRVLRALCLAWNEVSLQYLHGLSCEDPLTGLASQPHLRGRLDELYRAAARDGTRASDGFALVVVELGPAAGISTRPLAGGREESLSARFSSVLRLVEVAEALRTVFSGGETLARVGDRRAAVLVPRDESLATRMETLRQLLERWSQGEARQVPRVWVESLPDSGELTSALLDELAR